MRILYGGSCSEHIDSEPNRAAFASYLAGSLTLEEKRHWEEHIRNCEACSTAVQFVDAVVGAVVGEAFHVNFDPTLFESYLSDGLPHELRTRFDEHVGSCAQCAKEIRMWAEDDVELYGSHTPAIARILREALGEPE